MLLYPLLLRASSYSSLHLSNMDELDEFLDRRWLIDRGSCFRIRCGWLDDACMYRGVSFGFL